MRLAQREAQGLAPAHSLLEAIRLAQHRMRPAKSS